VIRSHGTEPIFIPRAGEIVIHVRGKIKHLYLKRTHGDPACFWPLPFIFVGLTSGAIYAMVAIGFDVVYERVGDVPLSVISAVPDVDTLSSILLINSVFRAN
jgi:hypothetical protein